jgi:hypothetical protein
MKPMGGLDRRTFAGALVAAGLIPAGRAAAAIVDLQPSSAATHIPPKVYVPPSDLKTILDIYKRMTVQVRINDSGPYAFVVDTGANQSVIAAEIATQLNLPAGDDQPLNGVAGVQITPTVHAELRIADRPMDRTLVSVLPSAAIGGLGILGLDQLDGGRLTLDFRRQTLSIDSGNDLPGLGNEMSLKAHRRNGQLILVDADLAGIPVAAFLDSGAQDTIGNMALRQLAITRYPTAAWSQTPIISVTGQIIAGEMADLPAFRIGGTRLPNWPMAFADLHTFQMWDLINRPAILIGIDILSRFETVCLDFGRDEVRMRLPQEI